MGGKRLLKLFVIIGVLGLVVSCAKRQRPGPGEEPAEVIPPEVVEPLPAEPEAPGEIGEEDLQRPLFRTAVEIPELKTVYFDYDKFELRPDAVATIEGNLAWLRSNPDKRILIEGHCDERGSEEYNLSLGDKRAKEVMRYLVKAGIAAARLHTISYGEEFPVDPRHNEEAWAKNRRAVFKVYE